MNLTEQLLNHDSIAQVEKELGKHHSEFNNLDNMYMLFKGMKHNKRTSEHLKSIEDTYFGMSWDYFVNLIKRYGFVEGLTYKFKHISFGEENEEQAIIYYHPSKGLVIWAETYGGDSVNGGTLYGMVKGIEDWKTLSKALDHCSHGSSAYYDENGQMIMKECIDFSVDIRKGLIHRLNNIESVTEFMPQWKDEEPFLWFVDYVEDKEPGYDYKEITKSKIKRCPQELQNIISLEI